jgi:hypothetical protein
MLDTPTAPPASSVNPELWEAAQRGAQQLGARVDWPIQAKNGWVAAAAHSTGNPPAPQRFTGRGATADAALIDLISKLPKSGVAAPAAHCATCTCSPEALANGQ